MSIRLPSVLVSLACGAFIACGGPAPATPEPSTPSASAAPAPAPSTDPAPAPQSTPAPAASAASADPATIALETFGVKITLPKSWTVRRDATSATALSPSGKSGFIFYAANDASAGPTYLHAADAAFHASVPFGLGKLWAAPSGLRFMRSESATTTTDKSSATAIVLLGTSPSVPGSSVGLLGVAVDGDGNAKAELMSAVDSIARR